MTVLLLLLTSLSVKSKTIGYWKNNQIQYSFINPTGGGGLFGTALHRHNVKKKNLTNKEVYKKLNKQTYWVHNTQYNKTD